MIFFSDRIEKFIPPKKGRKHILYIIRELLDFKPESTRTNIQCAIEYLTNVLKKRCTAFMLSDFIDDRDFQNALTIANRKHDVVALQVYDRRLEELPDVGLMKVRDAETGHEQWIDTSSKSYGKLITNGGNLVSKSFMRYSLIAMWMLYQYVLIRIM